MADAPREFAYERIQELKSLLVRLRNGHGPSPGDVETAALRAREARERAIETQLTAARRYEDIARAHLSVAVDREVAMVRGSGDVESNRRQARDHRTAAERNRQSARAARARALQLRSRSD